MFEHHGSEFFSSLVFHAAAAVVFGVASLLAGRIGRQIYNMPVGGARVRAQLAVGLGHLLPAVALLVVFWVSGNHPRYVIFVDPANQQIVRRETRLLPPGLSQEAVRYSDIRVIEGKMFYSGWWGDRYFLRLVTRDWRRINIAQGGRAQGPEELFPLAREFAEGTGTELDLSSKLPRSR